MTSTIGIMQALISVFIDDGDKIRCINAGSNRITFVQRAPLYYVCSSSWGEPESVVSTFKRLGYAPLMLVKEDTFSFRISASPNSKYCHGFSVTKGVRTSD
jgi:hypothetical protein